MRGNLGEAVTKRGKYGEQECSLLLLALARHILVRPRSEVAEKSDSTIDFCEEKESTHLLYQSAQMNRKYSSGQFLASYLWVTIRLEIVEAHA